ncbi:PA2169 family four-helix-bundle protein [Dyella humi]|uniref:PA2169 family four-helix-bundle protein n=1 Tax=Dyella humi TaxID=1770547 RepID=A0ABW8IHA2_9GAMM
MNAGDDISILNGLIGATLDSARHYQRVASNIGNPRIRALFEHLSTQRKQIAQTLQEQLAAVEGMPAAHASRVFGNLRHAMNYGYTALIDEVERGEEHVKAKYECALENERLSGLSRTVVENAYASVCEGCAETHALKRYPNAEQRHSERLEQW